ncbi:MAG: glutamine synthetase III [Kofleriaceae bacterium]|nr:glutamine synthetase III [Kofleriaceae bacterium]
MNTRTSALLSAATAHSRKDDAGTINAPPSSSFGSLSLPWQAIAASLDADTSGALADYAHGRAKLTKEVANRIADCVMRWALKNGATHYAHWFHPLTGVPAEKHDAFLARGIQASHVAIEQLPGSLFMQSEPDASSFPSGGLRATHEARGYTVWDPTSPLFIRAEGGTRTLCIPAAYVSWRGHALDYKTPLLRTLDAMSREVSAFINTVSGSTHCTSVIATLGSEQEYFLVDRHFSALRPDLLATGRTLVGAPSAKGQQLEDHYFGPIPARVQAFIADVEQELFRLGVPVKTRHCEVAPAQFETAPVFEEVNTACDHNVLTMDVLRRVAERHGLTCLLHEKPFAGVNGSGKHNNWSLATNAGENLLEPGHDAAHNLRFLATLAVVLRAMDVHNDLIRSTIASSGNEHRLGANEAPPAVMSVYLGSALDALVRAVADGKVHTLESAGELTVTARLAAKREVTDRNRTTPFAFTGNKFEFRAVGSSANCAWPMTVLNAAVAQCARELRHRIEKKGGDREKAVLEVVREVFNETSRVRFEGNNYSEEWLKEATTKRGLSNHATTPAALEVLANHQSVGFIADLGILTGDEIRARYEVFVEKYVKEILLEATCLTELATTHIAPAVQQAVTRLGGAIQSASQAGVKSKHMTSELEILVGRYDALVHATAELRRTQLMVGHDARSIADKLRAAMAAVRAEADVLEELIPDELWPLPKYREMLLCGV